MRQSKAVPSFFFLSFSLLLFHGLLCLDSSITVITSCCLFGEHFPLIQLIDITANTGPFGSIHNAQTHTSTPCQYEVLWDQPYYSFQCKMLIWLSASQYLLFFFEGGVEGGGVCLKHCQCVLFILLLCQCSRPWVHSALFSLFSFLPPSLIQGIDTDTQAKD